ncbi:unnamed protein product [Phytophthora fragariaefolia]|uniref:Unnamed protein product n=1 Tax=Phytophthora fragariaefolia TaxID=1490495 RepID=A0A9W7CZY3_9STRA|nr:unnamed protein product [Phytophthora fragariaefolia]
MQKFQAELIRNLEASSAETQPGRATTAPNSATPVKTEVNNPERATSAAATAIKSTKTQGVRTDAACPKQGSKDKAALKLDPKKSGRKPKPSRRKRPNRDLSPDSSDPSSDSDEDDSDSSSLSDSSGEKALRESQLVGEIHEKAPLGDRMSWCERFLNMPEQGGWTEKVKLSELRIKMSSAVRNWRGQLPKHAQADWNKLSREFRHKYLKTRTLESERCFTMKQKSGETPLEFLYRMNEAAVKAGIKYKSPATKRAQHIKRFMKNLRDKQLKAILVNQRFHDVDDIEYVLQQYEDLTQDGDDDMPPPKPRDFRVDHVHPGRFKPKRPGRAYVVQSDAESDAEQDGHVRFDDEVEDIETEISEVTELPLSGLEGPSLEAAPKTSSSRRTVTDEDIRNAVFCVMEHSGWRPAKPGDRPGWQSPRRQNPDRNEFCSECRFVRLPPEEEKLVDPDVLEFLGLDLVHRRYRSWGSNLGPTVRTLVLFRLRYWNITVSLSKSEFGKLTIPYLSHEISAKGLRATPKIAKGIQNLPFPKTLKGVQSFLGSLNYYHKLIADFPVVAAVLYELTDEQERAGRDLSRAKEAFEILKRKIVSTLLLRHPDRTKSYVIIPHVNKWAACAVLGQEYDGVIQPVRFTGRVLNDSEVRCHIAEKEVVAIMRVLDVFRTIVESCHIVVYTRYSVLSWLMKSKSADGRCVRWGLTLSHWDLEVRKVQSDEDGLAAILGAGITPRVHLGEVAEALIPAKGRVKTPPVISVEMLGDSYTSYVRSFDGAAQASTRQGSRGCVVWKLPGWHALSAHGFILEDVTENGAEYHGLPKGVELMSERNVQDLVQRHLAGLSLFQVVGHDRLPHGAVHPALRWISRLGELAQDQAVSRTPLGPPFLFAVIKEEVARAGADEELALHHWCSPSEMGRAASVFGEVVGDGSLEGADVVSGAETAGRSTGRVATSPPQKTKSHKNPQTTPHRQTHPHISHFNHRTTHPYTALHAPDTIIRCISNPSQHTTSLPPPALKPLRPKRVVS